MKKLVLMTLMCLACAAFCQNDPSSAPQAPSSSKEPASEGNWHFTWVPAYLWLSGVNGNVGVLGKTVPVDSSFSDVFDKLNIGYMTAADVRWKRIGLLTDFAYIDLSTNEVATPFGLLFGSAHSDSQMYILDPEFYGRIIDSPKGSVDGLVGFRYWHLRSNLDLSPGLLPAFHGSASRDWVDPVLGARFRLNLKRGIFVMLKGDGGGFGAGSERTWQIYTGVGKEFKQKYSVFAGYRRLSVDYRDSTFTYDTNMNGALLGFAIRFK